MPRSPRPGRHDSQAKDKRDTPTRYQTATCLSSPYADSHCSRIMPRSWSRLHSSTGFTTSPPSGDLRAGKAEISNLARCVGDPSPSMATPSSPAWDAYAYAPLGTAIGSIVPGNHLRHVVLFVGLFPSGLLFQASDSRTSRLALVVRRRCYNICSPSAVVFLDWG